MKNEFIPYKEALTLKELGFNEPCFAFYRDDLKGGYEVHPLKWFDNNNHRLSDGFTAPLYQQAFRWFRENHNLKHDIPEHNGEKFYFEIVDMSHVLSRHEIKILCTKEKDWSEIEFKTYEEAELACLRKLIEIVKK